MIKVTEQAMNHLTGVSAANDGKIPVLGLRGGGCSGFSYEWTLTVALVVRGHKSHNKSQQLLANF